MTIPKHCTTTPHLWTVAGGGRELGGGHLPSPTTKDTSEADGEVLNDGETAALGGVNDPNVPKDLGRQPPVDVVHLVHVRAAAVSHCQQPAS
ncbi:hypothetical protein E2562_004069 [Oryza meyeriana var. granulata]|uniref:Uncharacterized protein n=1 Tax=Oryza meyeriana var. granulata TaxID=110450 RepID=A0A6G1BHQ5_9ORYZ|nr:hypothetical protein E2562_004069 [Oryza meyeriana var. granulata]